MKIEFSVLAEHEAVAIETEGHLTAADFHNMRRSTVESFDEAFTWFDDMARHG